MRPLPQNLRIEFSAYIRSARQAQGLTIQEMAAQMGIHRARLGQLERAVHNVTFETMDVLVAHSVFSAGPLPPYSQTIAERVSQARAGRFSQERLSERAGLSVNFVNTLERGQANSSIDQIEALAVALGIDGLDLIAV
ncbi:helix-turn-helix domain-containing protein [Pseudoduganella sp. FT93W]|uniref:Helix-turn-helix domain-containing protein n=1 Tax=Duganella fentianensis TaxID=2692177 RepID=A0A845HXT0_9BURK|nr:helix-turn-helix transcriptional regulator [Duganella fentianensis]MYN45990.1 helix-turn-helix domain-containing protein [Duganella fentianensis]